MLYVFFIISFFWSFIFIYFFIKKRKYAWKIKKDFITYLETKGDLETLYKIGEYNRYGHRESRRTLGVLPALKEKFEETNDKKYEEYAKFATRSTGIEFFLFFGSFFGVFICIEIFRALLSK